MVYVELPDEKNRRLPFYLAMEEYIAREFPAQDYFFIWQVEPTVIFGRNQLVDSEVDVAFCRANNIQFYRRKSGGGCVFADRSNLMLSYITPTTNVNFTFNRYMLMVEHALQRLGVDDDMPISQKSISKTLEQAQKRIEGFNFDSRKNVVQYDNVISRHRKVVYTMRRRILKDNVLDVVIKDRGVGIADIEQAKRPENTGKTIVVVLPDTGERYLSTPMFTD